jgi:CubicO group peptidase (beta-lactamase class C family)
MCLRARAAFLSLLLLAGCATADAPARANDPQFAAIENGLPEIPLSGEAPLRLTLTQWLEALAIPGVSVAVIDDYQVVWAEGVGVVDANTRRPMATHTVLQAGSIAKAVTAMAALRAVERGELTLDGDVNDALSGWRVPENEFTAQEPVTLRRLLSHTAGITPGGFEGYTPDAQMPQTVQILNGAPPANSPPAQVLATPGTTMAYSGQAYTIVQLLLLTRGDETFPTLMHTAVLEPLNMIEMARARRGESARVLSHEMAQRMLTEERESSALGWMLGPAGGMFWHNGGTQGFRASIRMYSDTGDGIVMLTNSDNGQDVMPALMNAVAAHWQWSGYTPRTISPIVATKLIASQRGVERALTEYRAMRGSQPARLFGPGDLNGWGYMLMEQQRMADALHVFADNAGYYPDNAYAFDALGEAQLALGQMHEAVRSYRRSLELDPENTNATEVLARIEAEAR